MKTLLLTGASGFLGWNIAHFQQEDWKIIGTYHQNRKGIKSKLECIQVDLTNKDQTWAMIKATKPDAILHLAAQSSTNFCEQHPEKSQAINVTATEYLAEFCHEKRLHFLFTSSGQVFDGLKDFYEETDAPTPKNEYGKQKVQAEKFIQNQLPAATICRVPVMFGATSPSANCFIWQWLDNWRAGSTVSAFVDEYRSFLSGQSAAEGLFLLLNHQPGGIYHLGGGEGISRVTFAEKMKKVFHLPNAQIIKCAQESVKMAAYRPPKVIFLNEKMKDLGFRPKLVEPELLRLFQDL